MNEVAVECCQIDIRADDSTKLHAIAVPLFDCNVRGKGKRRRREAEGSRFRIKG